MAGRKRCIWPWVLVVSVGFILMLYPSITQFLSRQRAATLVEQYQVQSTLESNVSSASGDESLQEAQAYNRLLSAHGKLEILSPEMMQQYLKLLNPMGDGMMGTLQIPSLDVALPIYHTVDDLVMQHAIGHMPETSLPIGGESTHAVLAGHSGLANNRLLTDLPRMTLGQEVSVTVLGRTLKYQVDKIQTVLPDALDQLAMIPGEDYVTLLTCVPYGINSHRLLVRGRRILSDAEKE